MITALSNSINPFTSVQTNKTELNNQTELNTLPISQSNNKLSQPTTASVSTISAEQAQQIANSISQTNPLQLANSINPAQLNLSQTLALIA